MRGPTAAGSAVPRRSRTLELKAINPEANVYVLYRDIRTYGFKEDYYEKAREAGILFIRYDQEKEPGLKREKMDFR